MLKRALYPILYPMLIVQAQATRRRALHLPEAEGPRQGHVGAGRNSQAPLRILIAGDSSAAGVGVAHQEYALAGHLTRSLHRHTGRPVRWALRARSGLNTAQVHELLRAEPPPPCDAAVVVTGVNDVIDQVSAEQAVAAREALAEWLLRDQAVREVVFAPLPPVHQFPLLPQPLRYVAGAEARRHDRALADWAAERASAGWRISHLPIPLELTPEVMASDGFHPAEPVYRICGEALAAHLAARLDRRRQPRGSGRD